MLVVGLWPGRSGFASRELLGRPIWERALAAGRDLGAERMFWLGAAPARTHDGLEVVDPREASSSRDTLLVLPAELPGLTASSLRPLIRNAQRGPHALFVSSAEGRARRAVLAVRGSEWKRAVSALSAPRLEEVLRRLAPVPMDPNDPEELLLVDSAESFSRAAGVLRKRKVEALMRRGVLVSDPASVLVDPEVSVGAGTKLLPWVHLEGRTRVGRDAVISSFTHIVDSAIGAGTVVLDHCFIRESRVGKNVQIGPFAHLRPRSDVGAEARVGNFVELKNVRLGKGAKAPHLSYLGDAVIGKGSNVGAGTITCNYDGFRKHRTIVGDGAFIGSDVQLVAPVRVGKGAYVAAGSCIVEDVPADALALARSRQVVKRGWAKRRKNKRGT